MAAASAAASRRVRERTGRSATLVGAGILLSRIFGLIKQRFLSHYLGLGPAADAFSAAVKIPNFLQNLFGEGVLSASFIPVYARLLAEGSQEEADRVAGAVAALLALVTATLVLLGIAAAPWLVDVIAGGFSGPKRTLTIHLVRILFPGVGLLVMSAWCLGVLNSHRRFFLSYTAPVVWNLAIIVSLVSFGGRVGPFPLAAVAAWGSVVGSGLQLVVQLPVVFRLLAHFRPSLSIASAHVRTVVRNFLPVFVGRGVVQVSSFVDVILASYLPTSAVAALANAQMIAVLPVSLFGMSVSAAELPTMSSAVGDTTEVAEYLRARLDAGLRRIAFLVVPSAVAFLTLGDVLAGALFQTGKFTRADSVYVWGILAGASVGLLASTLGRLYSSTYYALRDTRTPLRYAIIRVILTTGLGVFFAIPLPGMLGVDAKWGAAGLTVSAGIAAWVEFVLLRRTLNQRIGVTGVPASLLAKLWIAAIASAAGAWGVKWAMGVAHPIVLAVAALIPFGLIYFGVTMALRLPEARAIIRSLTRRA
ncbi:MAG TPA: murein biosynthesis integral membrane protein MurJ [Gemmatimonadaceae bacterium]|nr:murein biosynthesis integral membrane protein MurJ [Gemmatimonadaceae bacterium]